MRTRILTILVVLAAATAAHAQVRQVRQYAAKFVCGKASDEQIKLFNFAPGEYFTSINVHNPARRAAVRFQKKFALAESSENPGRISEWFRGALKADEAMQIDCVNIYRHLNIPPGTFIDGFAVIEISTKQQLDVVGVYTAAGNGGVSAMHTERVAGRITQ
jgi:hypothetical protein